MPTLTRTPTRTPSPTPSPSDLHIVHVEHGPGLDNEYALIENRGLGDQDMAGWTLSDENDNSYFFLAGFILRGGQEIYVWTGSGTDTDVDLYWGRDNGVWGSSDTAYLRDNTGTVIDFLSWSSSEE
jgi:competence protein ComEC